MAHANGQHSLELHATGRLPNGLRVAAGVDARRGRYGDLLFAVMRRIVARRSSSLTARPGAVIT